MNVAIVGCGFVADYYLGTLPLHPHLRVAGVHDRQPDRARLLGERHRVPVIDSLQALLADPGIDLVLNLTNPRDHFEVSQAALQAGKHVYSEKPLAMAMSEARTLVDLAAQRGLHLSSAPCSLLGECAQTMWKAIRERVVGEVRVVYAEMDDGMVHRMPYRRWLSASGLPWPYKDEFEVGCTVEHAGYVLSWLAAWFGPARSVTAFASAQVPDKTPGEHLEPADAPDFSVACIQFDSGVVARLTCSILAPHDHAVRVVGDDGVLYTGDTWDYHSPVYSRKMMTIRRRSLLTPWKRRHVVKGSPYGRPGTRGSQAMDFARGPAEMAQAIRAGRSPRLTAQFSLHVNEMVLAIHEATRGGGCVPMTTRFDPIEPEPWAC